MDPFLLSSLLSTIGLGTALVFSSSHWLLAWMGLELNTLAILPFMINKHHPRAVEAATKYFIIQAAAAAIILFASVTEAWLMGEWKIPQPSQPLPITLALFALALKLGLAPIHFWLPEVLQGIRLITGLLLSTLQKVAPFTLMMQIAPSISPYLFLGIGVSSTFMGGWGVLNQLQLRKVLAFSSIAHLGWMMLVTPYSPSYALMMFAIYVTMASAVFMVLMLSDSTTMQHLATAWLKTPVVVAIFPPSMMSLGGLPPLTGFVPKWIALNEMVKQGDPLTATVAALSALLTLFGYTRLTFLGSLITPPSVPVKSSSWQLPSPKEALTLCLTLFFNILMIPLNPLIMACSHWKEEPSAQIAR